MGVSKHDNFNCHDFFFISKVWNETHCSNKYDIMAGNGDQRICGRNSRTRKRGGKCKYIPSNAMIDSIVELKKDRTYFTISVWKKDHDWEQM